MLFALSLFGKEMPSVALYYGDDPSAAFLERFDWVVVDPDATDPIWIKRYPKKLFAYVSVGEYEAWRHDNNATQNWKAGRNEAWQSDVMDLSSSGYRTFLLNQMEKLRQKGYENFFLDTLDSIFAHTPTDAARSKQKQALASLLEEIRNRFPEAKIIANRGVEAMDTLCKNVDAFAIESLYRGIDAKTRTYREVPQKDRIWIDAQLQKAKSCGLVPIVIDYLPASKLQARHEDARKIAEAGYVPYVTDRYLQHYGEGKEAPLRREVLLLYDSRTLKDGDKVYTNTHLMASMPLEYLGYIPVLKDIAKGLPYGGVDRYSGVIIWPDRYYHDQRRFYRWVKALVDAGQKVLFVNDFGFEMTDARAAGLGLKRLHVAPAHRFFAKVVHADPICGTEIPPLVNDTDIPLRAPGARALIRARRDDNTTFDAAALTAWGGYDMAQGALRDIGREPMWSIDPFAFFEKGLQLPPLPVPDPTTENGRRILFVHVDGDGFIEKARFAPKKYAAEVLYDQILTRYTLPQSISVIEGEIGPDGLYPQLAPKMMRYARKIYTLPHIEPASHSYSHPFRWQKAESHAAQKEGEGAYHLPIPGYNFSLGREINGSVGFINNRLLPKGKRCRLFFWTGDCLPREDALRMVEEMGLRAINGGDTTITRHNPWLVRIAPFGIQRGAFWQIYVGMQNENIYTNNWTGPFWGYRRVIETFDLTEKPRRLKPLNIYYHFYSASKTPSLDALRRVYDNALQRKTTPLFTSEYIALAHDFYTTAITQIPGGFHIRNSGNLRTLRLPSTLGYPDIATSESVVGFKEEKGYAYVHLDGSGDYRLLLSRIPPRIPYLIEANGRVTAYEKRDDRITITLHAHVGATARFALPEGWRVAAKHPQEGWQRNGASLLLHTSHKRVEVTFVKE